MFKKVMVSALVMCFVLTSVGLLLAADKGNPRKGKYLFRKNCRTCHKEGSSASDLSPNSKTQADWSGAFAVEAYQALACSAEWNKQSEKDLQDIYTYMYNHAFDSPSPAKCK